MNYFIEFCPQTFTNFSNFEIQHYKNMIDVNYYYDSSTVRDGFECIDVFSIFLLVTSVYLFIVSFCIIMFDTLTSSKSLSQSINLTTIENGVSCVKVPNVFSVVAKEYFKTETNMYLTFVGKLSLGRHLSKNVVRVDKIKNYLSQKDPVTKKEFRFLCYTTGDIENMKKETEQWIINNKSNWVSYFAY
tara:strand:+ start:182 stop:745 length:564 start_codon:yes stop_codon:yes gene_type:complete